MTGDATYLGKVVRVDSRDESFSREPGLRAALAYEVIYGKPVRELFAGLYEEIEQDIAKRAKLPLPSNLTGWKNSSNWPERLG